MGRTCANPPFSGRVGAPPICIQIASPRTSHENSPSAGRRDAPVHVDSRPRAYLHGAGAFHKLMDSSITASSRRQVSLIAGLAIVLIFVSGLVQGSVPFIMTVIGVALTFIAWVYAVFTAARVRQFGWVVLLVIGLALGLAL